MNFIRSFSSGVEKYLIERLRFTFTPNDKRQIQVGWEFLRIENKQIKTVQNNSYV